LLLDRVGGGDQSGGDESRDSTPAQPPFSMSTSLSIGSPERALTDASASASATTDVAASSLRVWVRRVLDRLGVSDLGTHQFDLAARRGSWSM